MLVNSRLVRQRVAFGISSAYPTIFTAQGQSRNVPVPVPKLGDGVVVPNIDNMLRPRFN
jgi:hypothetical protein